MSASDAPGRRHFRPERGERELEVLLAERWPPVRAGAATRVATLLGSRASVEPLADELRRMRAAHGEAAKDAEDVAAAACVAARCTEVAAV